MLAENASPAVSRKRASTSSSMITRGKAAMMSDGIGTMKRLMRPMRMRSSTSAMTATNEPRPSAAGATLLLASAAARHRLSPARSFWLSCSATPRLASSRRSFQICRHAAPERLARDDLRGARPRQTISTIRFTLPGR